MKQEPNLDTFGVMRETTLKLQELERFLKERLLDAQRQKQRCFEFLQSACTHPHIIEMNNVKIHRYPQISGLQPEEVLSARVCQLCGYRELRAKAKDTFTAFTDERIKENGAKLVRPNHSHWSVEEYTDLRPLEELKKDTW